MADMEAVDVQAAEAKKRPREDGECDLPDENPEKKLCSVETTEVAEVETPIPDAALEMKDEEPRAGAEPEAEKGEALVFSDEDNPSDRPSEAKLGPKVFSSSMDMFNYFYELLRNWPLNFDVNKYEHLMLVDLIDQGHSEADKKKGTGIEAFQVRVHPDFHSRCYYIVRTDGSTEDFSYRKCVDHILPLPDDFKARSADFRVGGHHGNRGRGGRGGGGRWGGGRRGGGGHGRGNRGRGGRF